MNIKTALHSTFSLALACLLSMSGSTYAEEPITLTFAFSDGDPPTSWANDSVNARGLLPELAAEVFKRIPAVHIDARPYPWPRAKLMAEKGQVDGLFTYPSDSRKEYLLFTDEPTYVIDYGYIIFNRENPRASALEYMDNYEDLSDFLMVTEGPEALDSWEDANLDHITFERIYVNKTVQMFHLVLYRNQGDYFVRNLEEARYIANDLGYGDKLGYRKMDFPTRNEIPFSLGIQKAHPQAEEIIKKINAVQRSEEFQQTANRIIERYQQITP